MMKKFGNIEEIKTGEYMDNSEIKELLKAASDLEDFIIEEKVSFGGFVYFSREEAMSACLAASLNNIEAANMVDHYMEHYTFNGITYYISDEEPDLYYLFLHLTDDIDAILDAKQEVQICQ